MNMPITGPQGRTPATPSRSQGTPDGYRNIRVLVPKAMHGQLTIYAIQSGMTLPQFVLAWLERATPLDPSSGPQDPPFDRETAPGHRQGQDTQGVPGQAEGPRAAPLPVAPATP